MPQVVTVTSNLWDLPAPFGRTVFYDHKHGYFYVFYPRRDDRYLVYRSSRDGVNWSAEEIASHTNLGNAEISVLFDGTYVLVAYYGSDHHTYVRKGTVNADGTITWGDPAEILTRGSALAYALCKTANYYYLALRGIYIKLGTYEIYVYKSSDGVTWSEIFSYDTGQGYAPGISIAPHPSLTDGVVLVWARYGLTYLEYCVYDGASWGDIGTFGSRVADKYLTMFNLVTVDGKTHIAYPPSNEGGPLRWQYFTGSWSSATEIDPDTCKNPSLTATSEKLHLVYNVGSDVRHRTMDYDTLTWSDYEVIASGENNPFDIQAPSEATAYMPVAWRAGTSSPYDLRFTYISLIISITKTLTETLYLSDQLSYLLHVTKTLSELIKVSDQLSYLVYVTKTLTDAIKVSDQLSYLIHVAKTLTETLPVSDQLSLQIKMYLSETIKSLDQLLYRVHVTRSLTDAIKVSDKLSYLVAVTKVLSDLIKVKDKWSTSVKSTLSEIIEISEVFEKIRSFIKLRYVTDFVDVFLARDHNEHVLLWKEQVEICKLWKEKVPEISFKVGELEGIVSLMRYVKDGEEYTDEDHNLFVSAWRKMLEILEKIASDLPEYSELASIVNEMEEIGAGVFYHDVFHNLFAEAWLLLDRINRKLEQRLNVSR
ncbi:MAG: hypothetical protein DRP00_02930 [Candidatus Aenigmatarchaeota archaeon]|nr:MAG: hypothetical protein DRP00_02930 [Candidatus Aenigmarchaeota archaeon]